MIRRFCTTAIALAAIISPAHALERWYSGNDLLAACRVVASGATVTSANAQLVGVCIGEIEGLDWGAPGMQSKELQSCVPDKITMKEMANAVVKFLDKNPDRQNEPFEGLVLEILRRVWPCTSTNSDNSAGKD